MKGDRIIQADPGGQPQSGARVRMNCGKLAIEFMKEHTLQNLLVLIAYSSLLFACGQQPTSKLDLVATQGPLLQFAATQGAALSADEPQSYLVAFRRLLTDERQHFSSYQSRALSHMQALVSNFSGSLAQKNVRYLSSLNLSDLSQSFVKKSELGGPVLLQQQWKQEPSMASLVAVEFKNSQEAHETLQQWLDSGRIWYAEPNGKSTLDGAFEDEIVERFRNNKLNTPWLEQVEFLPALQQVGALASYAEPVIAVMDSGVDVLHDSLSESIFINEQGQNKLCKDDIYGCNTTVAKKEVLGDGAIYPTGVEGFGVSCGDNEQCQHGTHVAGIIGARNAERYIGMCPYCKILVVKVVEIDNTAGKEAFSIKDSSIIAGLAYVSGFKAGGEPLVRVINASFGKFEKSRSVELFIKALKSFGRGTLMVAAAGNEDTMKRQYPAGFDSVIAVANVVSDKVEPEKSPSSNFGMWVDIAAPGDGSCAGNSRGILSSIPGGYEDCKVGTSMASPIVAGIAGLVLVKEPTLTAAQLEKRLLDTALPDKLYADAVNNGYRPSIQGLGLVPLLGSGVVNANAALDPTLDLSPAVSTQRSDLVRSGCGVIQGRSAHQDPAWWMLLFLPVFVIAIRFVTKKFPIGRSRPVP